MKRRKITAVLIMSMIMNGASSAGCSDTRTIEGTAENTRAPIIINTSATSASETSSSETETGTTTESSVTDTSSEETTSTEETTESSSEETSESETQTPTASKDYLTELHARRKAVLDKKTAYEQMGGTEVDTWCFKRMADHVPSGTYEHFRIKDYHGAYLNDHVKEGDKVIYLTFDCGYASKRSIPILDTLKKHGVKASFFVTKMYLEKCSDLAARMKEEGHMVCNHTVSHTDLTSKTLEEVVAEIFDVEEFFYEKTGYEMDRYFRMPEGTYSKQLMTIVNDAGYMSVFWSLAYNDYDTKNQPAPGFVLDHFTKFHHNGAVALMHNDSQSNVDELDAVLTLLENEGYRFGLLSELEEAPTTGAS